MRVWGWGLAEARGQPPARDVPVEDTPPGGGLSALGRHSDDCSYVARDELYRGCGGDDGDRGRVCAGLTVLCGVMFVLRVMQGGGQFRGRGPGGVAGAEAEGAHAQVDG